MQSTAPAADPSLAGVRPRTWPNAADSHILLHRCTEYNKEATEAIELRISVRSVTSVVFYTRSSHVF